MAFIVIVLALVVAICRLHILRKTQRGAGGRGTGAGRPHPPITLHDLDIYFRERNDVAVSGAGDRELQHIGITYNINHGVQIMGGARAGQPPPYSTNPRRGRARGRGPPPPYMSHENIAEPLLNVEDDNNNGDINGNSDMVDNNVRPPDAAPAPASVEQPQPPAPAAGPSRATTSSPPPRYPGLDSSSDTDHDTDFVLVPNSLAGDSSRNKNI